MSSANIKSNLENPSPLDGHENNDCDNNSFDEPTNKPEDKKISGTRKILRKMLHLLKEFIIMVLVAIAYAAVTNDPPKISKSPAAYRFFPDSLVIRDWYRGEISEAINHARSADIAFVMFYAPWDAESQHARREFQIAAKHMQDEVTFSAVNCWQPGSECRTQYSKVYRWPILIAYPTHGRGVQYNGPLVSVYMIQFLKKLINPFVRKKSVLKLLSQYDAVVVGKVNAEPYSREYAAFYQTTLRLLEKDPYQDIAVCVDTHAPYDDNGDNAMPQLLLYMWNETLIYPSSEAWEVEKLLNWIIKNVHQVATWVSPSGSKSMSLANQLQPGPALIFFTPKNPLSYHNDFYSMLREIGQEYNNCGDNTWIKILQLSIRRERREKYLEQLRLIEKCSMKKFKIRKAISPNLWSNTSYCLEKKHQSDSPLLSESSMVHYYGGISGLCVELLKNFDDNHLGSTKKCSEIKSDEISYKTSKLSDRPDSKSPENLRNYFDREICRTFLVAQKYQPLVFSSELYNKEHFNITGLRCRTNKTLSFISMDSLYYHHYAEKLGIDLSRKSNRTAVVILDDKMESHYIMSDSIGETNLKHFIYNYTQGLLTRASSSLTTVVSKYTHSYPINQECSLHDAKFCIKELSSSNFMQTISQDNKAVIIFYYSKQCSFCNGIAYRFLTVAKYFASIEEFQFARIDGDLNLLPWEYTMDIYPTILFVPPNKISESRVFPMDMPITIPNLISFILANLEPSLKLEAMWSLCGQTEIYSNVTECNTSLRFQTSNIIDKQLQEWRLTSSVIEKTILSLKLEHFHDLYTLLMHHPQNVSTMKYHFDTLKFLEMTPAESIVEIQR